MMIMKDLFVILCVIACATHWGCVSPVSYQEYTIDNQSGSKITVVNTTLVSPRFVDTGIVTDSSIISPDTQLQVYFILDVERAELIFENQAELPFEEISITNATGQRTKKDVSLFETWERELVEKDDRIIYKVTVTDQDF